MVEVTQQALEELGELEQRGSLTPSHVLARARDPQSALHQHFEWDDSTAAERYRMHQADRLICKVRVRIIPREPEPLRQIRASVQPSSSTSCALAAVVPSTAAASASSSPPAPVAATEPHAAAPPAPVVSRVAGPVGRHNGLSGVHVQRRNGQALDDRVDPTLASELLETALFELQALRRRYAHLDALAPVFAELDRLTQPRAETLRQTVRDAAEFARVLEKDGLDRWTAADRAAQRYQTRASIVLEFLRAS